jgi:hypothetical protein
VSQYKRQKKKKKARRGQKGKGLWNKPINIDQLPPDALKAVLAFE